jgi:hypothetical protein
MRKVFIGISILIISSCSPGSDGYIHKDDKGCPILTNVSSSNKITFVLKFNTPTDSSTFEQTVGPREDSFLGVCSEADKSLKIISGYIKNN